MVLKAETVEKTKGWAPTSPPDPGLTYSHLMSEIDHPDFLSESSGLPQRIDQWILDYLSRRDDSGRPLPLPDLFDRVSAFNARITTRIIQDKIAVLETEQRLVPPCPSAGFPWAPMPGMSR